MDAAGVTGRRDDVAAAFQADVVATCVGPVTAAAFELWGVPTIRPERSRLAAMVKLMETELPARRCGTALGVAGHQLLLHGDRVLLDGVRGADVPGAARGAPGARRSTRATSSPARSCSRRCRAGQASSEHAVEMAVARLRAAIGTRLVQTVVKRGYRLVVTG